MTTLVNRDPFARTELHRDRITPAMVSYAAITCDWCGQPRKDGSLYKFQTESDGGRIFPHKGRFCSVGCFRCYHS